MKSIDAFPAAPEHYRTRPPEENGSLGSVLGTDSSRGPLGASRRGARWPSPIRYGENNLTHNTSPPSAALDYL